MPKKGSRPSHSIHHGVEGKTCGVCEEWKPLGEYYRRSSGSYHFDCRTCRAERDARRKGPTGQLHGFVPYVPSVCNALTELIHRVGKAEASRLTGLYKSRISTYLHHPPQRVQKETARVIFLALRDVRASGLVLSRDSIRSGAFERGKVVSRPSSRAEYYKPNGETEAEYKRRSRERVHSQSDEADPGTDTP